MATQTQEKVRQNGSQTDMAESVLRTIDESTTKATRVSIFHILTIASIGASIGLYLSGKKQEAIFVGLWPPTFEALKSAASRMANK